MRADFQHFGLAFALLGTIVLIFAAVAFRRRLSGGSRRQVWFDVDELKRRSDAGEDLLVMDVRTAEDFVGEQGHLTFASNLPLEQLNERLGELGEDRRRPIAIVCRTDRRSAKAEALLVDRGFVDVHVVRGGMTAWLDRGWPVERDA